jgi:hypothetical protein
MRIKKKNVARLASLSALGAGALGVAAGTAEASGVIVSSNNPSPIAIVPGSSNALVIPLLNASASVRVGWQMSTFGNDPGYSWQAKAWGAGSRGSAVQFLLNASASWLQLLSARPLFTPWTSSASHNQSGKFASGVFFRPSPWTWVQTGSNPWSGHSTYRGKQATTWGSVNPQGGIPGWYASFQFTDTSGNQEYGWLQLSASAYAPQVQLDAWAYTETVPEPSSISMAGLAALALGAVGMRRWRKRRLAA